MSYYKRVSKIMSRKRQDLTGLKFNKLTAIKYITSNKFGSAIWLFKCDCGQEKEIILSAVKSGNTKSCGCIQQTKYQDLIGKKFGRLTLIKFSKRDKRGAQIYLCECECGKKKEIRVSDILCGTKSCGCQRSISKTINLTGKKYNKLTAIKFSKKIKNCRMWLWKCDCGNEKEAKLMNVKHTTVSCGCYKGKSRIDDIAGKKFGKLTPIKMIPNKKKTTWLCKCDCGNEIEIKATNIKRLKHKSCGCAIPYGPSVLSRFHEYQNGAKSKNRKFKLTFEEFEKLITNKCYYCGQDGDSKSHSDDPYGYCGIDRTNNNIGYIKNNCVSCCKKCNFMKKSLNIDKFLNQIKKINAIHI